MTRSYIIGIIVAILIIVGLAIYLGSKPKDVPKTGNTTRTATTSNQTQTNTASSTWYTFTDIAQHDKASDCWAAYGDKVYNFTNFINQYSGNKAALAGICGKDATPTLDRIFPGQNIENMLNSYQIGNLETKE